MLSNVEDEYFHTGPLLSRYSNAWKRECILKERVPLPKRAAYWLVKSRISLAKST